MKNVVFCLLAVAVSLVSCMGKEVGPAKKFTKFEGSPITGLRVGSGFEVTIEQGPVAKAEFEVSSHIIERLEITLDSDGTLGVVINNGGMSWNNPVLKLHLICPTLEQIDGSGAASIRVTSPFSLSACSIEASGASDISFLAPIDVLGVFQLDASGASEVEVRGLAGGVDIEASGASKVDCSGLVTERAQCEVSGASKVRVYGSLEVMGSASGAADVEVLGGGSVRVGSSGGSSVRGN